MKRFLIYVSPIIAWAVTIFILSAQSKVPHLRFPHYDKIGHAGIYAMLGLLLARAFVGYGRALNPSIYAAIILASLYGASDEIHQHFTPGRTPDVFDWVADTVGSAAGAFFWVRVVLKLASARTTA